LDYFEKNYVGRPRLKARFPVDVWNCRDITLDNLPRTTNSAESWHNAFQGAFSVHHPNPYNLIDCLLTEQVRADFLWTRLELGERPPLCSNVAAREENERLLNVIKGYDRTDVGGFLKACSYYAHFPA
jgi:hypothetical protein